jgi:hypothetical protein
MDYDKSRELALRLILKFGKAKTATIYRRASTFDPLTGNETGSETPHTIEVVVIPSRDATMTSLGSSAIDHDIRFMVPATGLTIEPKSGDQVTLPGRSGRFGIVDPVEKIAADGDDVAFTCLARRIGD